VALLLAILGLGLLIVIHELGHMLVARLCGMRVDRFSIGFGPALARWRGKRTTYQLAMIPLGGFVQIAGMNPHEQLPADDPGSYARKSARARFATIFAGPLTNYLCASAIMVGVLLVWGIPRWEEAVAIKAVAGGTPAAQAGIRGGDVITAVDGRIAHSAEEVIELVGASKGKPLHLDLARGGRTVSLMVRARLADGAWRIGVEFDPERVRKLRFTRVGVGGALALGALYPYDQTRKVLSGLGQLARRKESLKQVGGPLEIVRQLKMSFEDSVSMALIFLAMLNVYLGLFNLLPVPALDGGRLVFLTLAMVIRRPVNQRVENAIHTVGFLLLLGLILLVTYRDIVRIFVPKAASGP
jgi:regulator of sigma E protease